MASNLNPEAPEFYPHLTSVTQNGFKALSNSIQASNLLPAGMAYDTFKTFTNFNIIVRQFSDNITEESNKIFIAEKQKILLKSKDREHNIEQVIELNDNILDRANINIDIAAGIINEKDPLYTGIILPNSRISTWNTLPVVEKVQMGTASLIGARNIPNPQFGMNVDNSENLWVPKITDKPNSIKPLALSIIYNDNGEAVGYEHPYKMELEMFKPPDKFLELDPSPPLFPPPLEETTLTYVDTEEKLDALVDHLRGVDQLAVDVEHHSYRTYQGITCLLQLSTDSGGDFIVDTIILREHMHKLNLIFTDPNKLKVFHGADMDVIWLQRDLGVYLVGLMDTHQAAKLLKLPGLSLKYLLLRYCQINADKKFQLADWRMRPLPDELVTYARSDTHYLLYIWRRIQEELVEYGGKQSVRVAFGNSRHICSRTYRKEVVHEESHLPLYVRSRKSFNSRQMFALKALYKWRDVEARKCDESTGYLLPNHMLLSLAESLPREVQGVNGCCGQIPPFVKKNLLFIHKLILSCRELPLEPQLYQMPLSISTILNHHKTSNFCFHDLTYFPELSDDLPVLLTSDDSLLPPEMERVHSQVPLLDDTSSKGSDLNVDAKSFIPPYDRYRKYRAIAQIEEIKEFKQKEAKIAAIAKGDEIIQKEVLAKLKKPELIEQSLNPAVIPVEKVSEQVTKQSKKEAQRKRKMSTEIVSSDKSTPDRSNQYDYNNVNYDHYYNKNVKLKQKFTQYTKPRFKKNKK